MKLLKQLFNWLAGEIKQTIQIIKDNLFLIVGVGLFVYGLFYFAGQKFYFFYDHEISLFLLVAGAIFITIGVLKARKK